MQINIGNKDDDGNDVAYDFYAHETVGEFLVRILHNEAANYSLFKSGSDIPCVREKRIWFYTGGIDNVSFYWINKVYSLMAQGAMILYLRM